MSKTPPTKTSDSYVERIKMAESEYRMAIRWLFDADRFKNSFSHEGWRDSSFSAIEQIAKDTYNEAIASVIAARRRLVKLRKDMRDMKKKE